MERAKKIKSAIEHGRETLPNGVEVVCDGLQFEETERRHYCIFTGGSCGYKQLYNCRHFIRHILPRWVTQGKYTLDLAARAYSAQ